MRPSAAILALVLALALAVPGLAEGPPKTALADYFPPPESKGGWRSLLPETGEPTAAQKEAIAKTAGVDWDKLAEAWEWNAQTDKASGLLVIRKGYVVGEWYKDGGRDKAFNIFSSSKAYTSLALGLILADSDAGKLPDGKKLTLDTKVYTKEWLPEGLPPSDPRKTEITVRQLLNMASGVGPQQVPRVAPFEAVLGKTKDSKFVKLMSDPGTKFYYSNGGVAHLVLVARRATGRDLFPFLKGRVFDPVGVEKIRWQQIGGDGHLGPYSQGFSGIFTTPREHARFCYLALHEGTWAGKPLVPSAHYDFAWKPSKTNPVYGGQWWLSGRYKGVPKDLVQTAGAFHNDGYVVPSLDLVFVRLGDSRKFPKDFPAELVRKVLAAVKK